MADEADLGNESMAMHLRLALHRCRDAIPACRDCGAGREDYGGSEVCIDCGEEIPEARRIAVPGCRRCLACQIAFEQREYGRPAGRPDNRPAA